MEEDVSKKARAARNVIHIRGEDELKFDVNEEDRPNAELAVRSCYEGALIDGLPACKVKAGDEGEITQMKNLQLYSWIREEDVPPEIDLAYRLGTTDERKRSEIAMCPEGFFHNSETQCICTDVISSVGEEISFVPQLGTISVWRRLHGAMHGMQTAN